ncbi:MAG: DUF1887 family protein [Chloroflexi bacterium]|nr:DUF1887 family protein [Chloroflexota bacterium]
MILLSLVGEQPLPSLLVSRALKPARTILLYTTTTERVAGNLAMMMAGAELKRVDAYDFVAALAQIRALMAGEAVINLTGGTKPMALAAYEAARAHGAAVVYLESEKKQSLLYRYAFAGGESPRLVDKTILPPLIDIDDYLRVHGLRAPAEHGPQNPQEAGLGAWLKEQVDECRRNLVFEGFELDFILRRGNQVAIMEAKMAWKGSRAGIDQLNTAGGQTYLGTYTGKILVTSRPLGAQLAALAEARRIRAVTANGQVERRTGRMMFDAASRSRLLRALEQVLGPK